jgi:hypothetical protein
MPKIPNAMMALLACAGETLTDEQHTEAHQHYHSMHRNYHALIDQIHLERENANDTGQYLVAQRLWRMIDERYKR